MTQPARVARWCGLDRLTDGLHGRWMQQMICGREDMTLLAHRGSYKTTCLAFAMAAMILLYPMRNIIFLRKTDDDVTEVLRQVKMLLRSDALQYLSEVIYGRPVTICRSDMFTVHTGAYSAMRGAVQLMGLGTGGSLTGKHADVVITDDIVNLTDRLSAAERERTRQIYQELQNIRNPGGRIINCGTPGHPEDAISRMPRVFRYDCYRTGLLSPAYLKRLQQFLAPSLFAANYELKHIAAEDALFPSSPETDAPAALLRDGFAHVDAAYGGGDCTALTCGRIENGRVILYGRLWRKSAEEVLSEIADECNRLQCAPVYVESNADKGALAREMRRRGLPVRVYHEGTNKHIKIVTWLKRWWPRVILAEGTDRAWLHQILDYNEHAAHDDAPDSAASLLRIIARHESPEGGNDPCLPP